MEFGEEDAKKGGCLAREKKGVVMYHIYLSNFKYLKYF